MCQVKVVTEFIDYRQPLLLGAEIVGKEGFASS